ncbi:hypothetical protein ACTVZO_00640 [Streptomyces sp. IBSNAI002]|uniref:hypothetical protein n=1 Tax=Streptomyces sp. IBSNAI002 TaxID=3457500 RepID=UPI003FCF9CE5
MRTISTEITIDAAPEEVWVVLVDGEHYFRLSVAPGNKTTIEHVEHFRGALERVRVPGSEVPVRPQHTRTAYGARVAAAVEHGLQDARALVLRALSEHRSGDGMERGTLVATLGGGLIAIAGTVLADRLRTRQEHRRILQGAAGRCTRSSPRPRARPIRTCTAGLRTRPFDVSSTPPIAPYRLHFVVCPDLLRVRCRVARIVAPVSGCG